MPARRDHTPGRSQAREVRERTDGVAPRSCSDLGCCFAFVSFLVLVGHSCFLAVERMDLQKLTRGIDHRGRICGWTPGTEKQKLLHWCVARTQELNFSSPICVAECPLQGSSVLCPGQLEVSEEETSTGGRLLLVRTEKQLLSPSQVPVDTKTWLERYCVPELDLHFVEPRGVDQLLDFLDRLRHLAAVPRLLAAASLWVVLLSMAYLVCLRYWALFLVHAAVLASLLLSLSGTAGFLLIWNPRALPTGLKWLPPAAQDTFQAASGWVPAPLAASMSLLLFLAAASLTGCLCARRRLDVACDCIRESCALMLAMPSLLLLPLLDALCSYSLSLLLILSVPVFLSSVELSTATVMGIEGLFRRPHLGVSDYVRVTTVVFSCFWVQEVIGAACCLATAYSVATWYFAPGKSQSDKAKHLPLAPAIQGLVVAMFWHLGSLARGAFTLALLRLLRWALWLLHVALRQDVDDPPDQRRRRRCCQCFTALCSSLLAALQAWTEFLSSHAYVDIVLSSHSYGVAVSKAAELLRSHAALVSVLSLIAWFLRVMGSIGLAVLAGGSTWMAITRQGWLDWATGLQQQLGASGFPSLKHELGELLGEVEATSGELMGVVAAIMMLFVSQAVLSTVECTACTVLYCLLWDGSDGVLDASHVPESFWKFAKDQGIAGRRTGKSLQK